MICVPDCGRQIEVAGGEIWSTVACSRLHIIFKTVELVLSGSEFPVTEDIQTEAGYIFVRVIVEEIPAVGGSLGPSMVGDL